MKGLGGVGPALARAGLAVATCGLAVSGVVVATEGTTFPGTSVPTLALAPAAAVGCEPSTPYRPPARGSVGVPPGMALCPSGPVVVTVAGAVLDGWDVRGGILVDAPDVVVRRSRVTGDGTTPYGISTTEAGSVRIEDTTLTGAFPEAAIAGDRWSGERVEIVGVTHDGARLGESARLRNSSLHGFTPAPGAEVDALVLAGAGGAQVEDNAVELGAGPARRAALLLAPAAAGDGGEGPTVIRGNVFGGGRYTLLQDSSVAAPPDLRITGNRFRRGREESPMRLSSRALLEDNTYLDGAPLPER
jgi:hypothetical protein